jgi:hypothetical protein
MSLLKSKKAPYILAPLLLGVWGLVIYKAWQMFASKPAIQSGVNYQGLDTNRLANNDYTLQLNYRDPFGGGGLLQSDISERSQVVPLPNAGGQVSISSLERPAPVVAKTIQWPSNLQYKGFMRVDEGVVKEVGLVKINGRIINCKLGDSLAQCRVQAIYPDSLVLLQGTQRKAYPRL